MNVLLRYVWLTTSVALFLHGPGVAEAKLHRKGEVRDDHLESQPAVLWYELADNREWSLVGEPIPGADGEVEVHLEGDFTIRMALNGPSELKTSGLTLRRESSTDSNWYVPPEEIDRIGVANGLPRSTSGPGWWMLLGAAVLAIVAAVGLVIARRFSGSEEAPSP